MTDCLLELGNQVSVFGKELHHLVARLYLFLVLQWQAQPTTHQSSAHRRHRLIDDIDQGLCIEIGRVQQLQITDGKLVKPNVLTLVDTRKRSDMIQFVVLRLNQIMYCCTSCHDALREVVDAETFQRDGVEMLVEHLVGVVVGEDPIVEDGEVVLGTKKVDEVLAFVALHQHLGRVEALQQLVDVFVVALSKIKLAC